MIMFVLKGSSSAGRAAVSKTAGRRFDPCLPCHFFKYIHNNYYEIMKKMTKSANQTAIILGSFSGIVTAVHMWLFGNFLEARLIDGADDLRILLSPGIIASILIYYLFIHRRYKTLISTILLFIASWAAFYTIGFFTMFLINFRPL
jgi:hypothetical protein